MTCSPTRDPSKRESVVEHVRLDLTIGGTTYELERLADGCLHGSPAFRLIKDDGTIYDVAQTDFGTQCDCPDYIFRRDGFDPLGCKHIKALVRLDLLER